MTKLLMQLETLNCPTCIKKIEETLYDQEGVDRVTLLFNSSKAKVNFDEQLVTALEIQKLVEALGYKVHSLKTA